MVSGIFGLTGYIPLNQNWKLKITQGITIFDLYRYPEEFKNAPYFYFAGYGGSVSAMWLPVKHFGVSMGVDYNAGYARENVKFNYNDFLGYVSHNYYLCLKPFIGGTVVLGKNN